jgi:Spy/CpxP family protein refolding chaperone
MERIARWIPALILTGLLALPALAGETDDAGQRPPGRPETSQRGRGRRHRRHPGRVGKALQLTEEQKAKAKQIMQKAREDAKDAETHEQKRKIMKAAHGQLQGILTDEQKQKAKELREQARERMEKRRTARRKRMAEALGLSEEQQSQAKEIMQGAREKAEAAETREQKHEIMQNAKQQMEELLTAEQKEKLEQLKARRGRDGRRGRMGKALDLTDEQKAKAKEIFRKAREDAKDAGTPEAKREIFQNAKEQMERLLTEEQKAKLEKLKEQRGTRGRRFGQHRGGPFSKLDLTDTQKEKIHQIIKEAHTKAEGADTPEQKRQIRKAVHQQIVDEVLTPQQKQKIEQMRKRHQQRRKQGKRGPGADDEEAPIPQLKGAK